MLVRVVSTCAGALSPDDGETMAQAGLVAAALRIPVRPRPVLHGCRRVGRGGVAPRVGRPHGPCRPAPGSSADVVVTGPPCRAPRCYSGWPTWCHDRDAFALVWGRPWCRLHGHPDRRASWGQRHPRPVERPVRHRGRRRPSRPYSTCPTCSACCPPTRTSSHPAPHPVRRSREVLRSVIRTGDSSYDVRKVAAALADDSDVTELWRAGPPARHGAGPHRRSDGRVRGQPVPGAGRHARLAASQKGRASSGSATHSTCPW